VHQQPSPHGAPRTHYSPDGHWWWDGERWVPVFPVPARPQSVPQPARSPRAWPWVAVGGLLLVMIVVTAVAGATAVFPPGVRRLILGGGSSAVSRVLATAPPPGAQAIPAPDTQQASSPGPLDARAITAQVVPTTVNLDVRLHYGLGEAGGTGIVLTSSGLVLTDEHVIFEGDRITAQVGGRGRLYQAALIGADPADDVALLQLEQASGLRTATLGTAASAGVGDQVLVIGYPAAGLVTVRGTITDRGVASSVVPDGDWPGANVTDMLESSANVISGQSGGPVVDASGRVIGMLESGGDNGGALATPTEDALLIATQIAAGRASYRIVIGLPAVLGVVAQDANGRPGGAQVVSVHSGTPADSLGLHPGDVITKVDGSDVTSALELALVLVRYHPGDRASLDWTGLFGARHRATVTLAAGPAP
jgi:S1-C subfamily serine protease